MANKNYAGNPSWLKWLVLAFVAYAAYLHFTGEEIVPTAPRETGKAGLTNASRSASPLPDITDTQIKIGGDIKGSGDEAQCGQTAMVRVSATLPDGKEYKGKAVFDQTQEVKVGAQNATYPWMAGLTGMGADGVREVLVPLDYVFDEKEIKQRGFSPKDKMTFRVHMDSLSPASDPDAIPMRVMDTLPGRGPIAYCGDNVTFTLVLWKQDGSILFDSGKEKPLVMQLGDATVFYGLDRALVGMREGSVRTAIIPPSYIASSHTHPAFKAVPAGQIAIADITLLKVEKPKRK